MNELEQQHIKKAAILKEKQDLLRNFQACIENTVQGVLSTIHSSDNANILSIRSAIESTLAAATENQFLALSQKPTFYRSLSALIKGDYSEWSMPSVSWAGLVKILPVQKATLQLVRALSAQILERPRSIFHHHCPRSDA